MSRRARAALLIAGSGLLVVLGGCPGMPGGPGGQQSMPPGVLPPPGMESGGAYTLMGTTITPPDNAFLLVKYASAGQPAEAAEWQSCRRIIPLDNCVLVEGVNHDGRAEGAEKDVNQLLPFAGMTSLYWKYEPKPLPPPSEEAETEGKAGEEGD